MKQRHRGIAITAALVLLAALAATPATARDDGVTFKNMTAETHHILAVHGEGDSCDEKSGEEQLTIEAGESATIPSGDSEVCWCSSTFGKVGDCGTWTHARPGSVQKIR